MTTADTTARAVPWRGVTCYVLLAYGLMWLVCLPLWISGDGLATSGALAVIAAGMWTPALASFLTCRFVDRQPWRARVGLGPGTSLRTLAALALLGFAAVTACMVAATALGGVLGLAHLDVVGLSGLAQLEASLPAAGRTLPPPMVLVLVSVAGTVVASFTVNALAALGEEVGWRGYLVPALLPLGRARAMVAVGVVWAFWHTPIVLLGYDYDGAARPLALLALTGFCIAVGTLLAWLRMRSDSAIPAAVAHGTLNGWMLLFPVLIAAGQPANLLTASPMGIVGIAVFAVLAGWLLTRRWGALPGTPRRTSRRAPSTPVPTAR